jgi:hypothetical protein
LLSEDTLDAVAGVNWHSNDLDPFRPGLGCERGSRFMRREHDQAWSVIRGGECADETARVQLRSAGLARYEVQRVQADG